jgi:hypothetical protein
LAITKINRRILMLKQFAVILVITASILLLTITQTFGIDAGKDGPIYGDPDGLARVAALENELHNMKIRSDHPRLFINNDTLPIYQARVRSGHPGWININRAADGGDMVSAAFAYLMLRKDSPVQALNYANIAIAKLKTTTPQPWASTSDIKERRKTALMALAFDWVYDAMNQADRTELVNKLGTLADITGSANRRRAGALWNGETFHREEWIFYSWEDWAFIALANHYTDADFVYKTEWNYNWFYGDAARMYAYAPDGTPFEGYYTGADGIGWFLTLKSATGINLVDDPRWSWGKGVADYILYRLDLGMDREIFHKGVALGAGGLETYKSGDSAWKIKAFFGSTFPLGATTNPYFQWLTKNKFGTSRYLISNEYYNLIDGFEYICDVLFYDPLAPDKDPKTATYSELPYAKYFPDGNNVYMRTGWTGSDVVAGLRVNPAYTMTSHSDFDANTFVIYRKGNISPDSGIYDAYANQSSYFSYQKQTYSHNDILVIDPADPNGPTNISGFLNPGGTDYATTKTFSSPAPLGNQYTFVHNSKANWGDIIKFVTTPEYDYTVGDATKAYSSRLNEYYRNVVFLRKGTKAYMIVFDRVESKNANFDKRWLMHFVSEPKINGNKVSQEVVGHIDTYDGDLTIGNNVYNTSAVYVKTLLPKQHKIRRIGGTGYEFYREGTNPINLAVPQSELDRVASQMGGPWQEAGTWRIELSPTTKQTRDYFLNVMYIGDPGETMPQVMLVDEGGLTGVIINDTAIINNKIMFTKTGVPDAIITASSIQTDSIPPSAIQNLAITSFSDTTASLSWTATGDDGNIGTASSYNLRYSKIPLTINNWAQATQVSNVPNPKVSGTQETFTINGLTPSTTYYVGIKAIDDCMNEGTISNIAQFTTQAAIDTTTPTKPTGLAGLVQSEVAITLSWQPSTDNNGVTGYNIYRNGTKVGTSVGTSYDDKGLQSGTTYTYQVSAYDAAGNESVKSDTVSATTKNEVIPPVISLIRSTNITATGVTISWTTDEPSTSQVEYGKTSTYGTITIINTNLVTDHSVIITGLSSNTAYNYRVISKDKWNNEAKGSNNTFTTISSVGKPGKPQHIDNP